jgi:hypothetical protein
MQKKIKALVAISLITSQTACSSLVGENLFTGEEEGRFLLSADAAGIRAFSDGLNGLVTTGKASPDTKDAYWQRRESGDRVRALKWQFRAGGKSE